VSQTFPILKANQTITFDPIFDWTYGTSDRHAVASASSSLPVSFTASGNCTVNGTALHVTGVGACTITASQSGDANYNAAPDVSQTFAIAKGTQTIRFRTLPKRTFGDHNFAVSASASSGLRVSFSARGSCTEHTATVHLTGPGSCTITASQPGDAKYESAPHVSRRFTIARAPCRVPKVVGKPLASAKSTIAKGHCRSGTVHHAYSSTKAKGTVVSQSSRAGRVLPAGARIDLVVSRGRR
jgi:hypothetical protein